MNKIFNKFLMVLLAVIVTLSSAPISSFTKTAFDSPVSVVAQAATKKTHINKTKKSIYIGKKYTLKLIDKKGKTISASKVKWSRSNKTVASVSKKGVVTGKKAGKIKITATYKGKKYTSVITVKSAVSASKTKVTFDRGATAKKTIKITCKDDKGIKWTVVSGKDIVNLSQAKKWKNDTKSFYITPTGKKFGKVKIKIYSKENSNSYVYVNVDVKAPYALKVKDKLPCTIYNYKSQDDYDDGIKQRTLKINKVTYKTPDVKTLKITVNFEARKAPKTEDYYYIRCRLLDKDGYLVETKTIKSKLMMVGDKAKSTISFSKLKNGTYTIDFSSYIGKSATSDDNTQTSKKEVLKMYQKSAKAIHENGVAGYTKKSWQTLDYIQLSGNSALSGTLKSLVEGFLTTESDAEERVSEKGSEEAMMRMPISNCSEESIKSYTVKSDGNNYILTIVMKEQTNPAKADTDGINVMGNDILYMEDIYDTVNNDSTIKQVVKSLDKADITYHDYTITAKMTKDGKIISITHYCNATFDVDMRIITGDTNCSGALNFNTKYYNFQY